MCGCLLRALHWGPDPQPMHVPRLGIEPVTLLVHRLALNALSHTSQGQKKKFQHFGLMVTERILNPPTFQFKPIGLLQKSLNTKVQ